MAVRSGQDKEMDQRVGNLEKAVAVLQTSQDGITDTLNKVAKGQEVMLSKLMDMDGRLNEMEGRKPFSLHESLTTVISTISIVAALYWTFDYMITNKVSRHTEESTKMADLLFKDGEYFLLKDRVSRLEKAVVWTPQIVTADSQRR